MCGPVCSPLGFRRRVVVVSHLKSTQVVVGGRSSGASGRPRRGSPSSMFQGAHVCGPVCSTLGFCRRIVGAAHLKSTLVVVRVRSSGASGHLRRGSQSSMSQGECLCGSVCSPLGFRRRAVVVSHLKSTVVVVGGRSSGASGRPRRGSPSLMSQGVCVWSCLFHARVPSPSRGSGSS